MNKLINWIRYHQVAAFFIVTFAIMLGLGFSWNAVLNQDQGLLLPLAFVSACGPGLAGIIVSAISNTQPRGFTQGILDCFSSSVVTLCISLSCQLSRDHHFHSFDGTGCIYPRLNLFPESICEKTSGFVDSVSRCMGLVTPGIGVVPSCAHDFIPRQQSSKRAADYILSIPRY